jgi:hypothetical protein
MFSKVKTMVFIIGQHTIRGTDFHTRARPTTQDPRHVSTPKEVTKQLVSVAHGVQYQQANLLLDQSIVC